SGGAGCSRSAVDTGESCFAGLTIVTLAALRSDEIHVGEVVVTHRADTEARVVPLVLEARAGDALRADGTEQLDERELLFPVALDAELGAVPSELEAGALEFTGN